ncbi:MAG: hypothetical protein ACK2VD_08935 [Anaerolineae bacterium]|jgi:NAD dependent epimerase/dehydratase family enzyme
MPEQAYWEDLTAKEELQSRGRVAYARIRATLEHQGGVLAVEPQSGTHFWGRTLGEANRLAYEAFPDQWLYFCRLDDPTAEIVLPTW